VRTIDETAIKRHSNLRFRSEYDYALFEYYRSAKVIAFLERSGVRIEGAILDAGCGGGGMPVSLAEEAASVVGIDLRDCFRDAGARLTRERRTGNLRFAVADGTALPFPDESFDLVLSHAVIEHVADARRYLSECARVLKRGGWMYLSTAPYLSFAGAHLPRLKVPLPLHLILGRPAAFAIFRCLARHAAWTLREPANENSFIKAARRNEIKQDDLLEKVRVGRLRRHIAAVGLTTVREELHVTSTFRRAPGPIARWLRDSPLTQDIIVGSVEYILRRGEPSKLSSLLGTA
jgi:ubiquinone/menaquinone biosynthesis C-methylase UbiE